MNTDLPKQLLPELKQYLTQVNGYSIIQHPYFFNPYSDDTIQSLNDGFEVKKQMVSDALIEKDYDYYVHLFDNNYRLDAFLHIQNLVNDEEYWELLSSAWVSTRKISNHKIWKQLFSSKRPNKEYMMCDQDRVYFNNLPDTFKIYRGFYPDREGFAYSINKSVALAFAANGGDVNNVIEKTVYKNDCVCYINERSEQEIIYLF